MTLDFTSSSETSGGSDACLSFGLASTGSTASPSTSPPAEPVRTGGVFELKFLANEFQAESIIAWARATLQPDPHCEAAMGDGYHVNSLYLDTPTFDIYRRGEAYRQQKFRLRRYGTESTIWLESKAKEQRRVWKRRTPLAESLLQRRLLGLALSDWDGLWFRSVVDASRLQPVCQVTYERRAWIGLSSDGPIRLTLDRDLRAGAAREWQVPGSPLLGPSLLGKRRIVEFKFPETLPASFRRLLQELTLETAAYSKYRTCVEATVPLSVLAGEGVDA